VSIPRLLCCFALLATATLAACGPAPTSAPDVSGPTLAPATPTVTRTNAPASPVAAPVTPTTDSALAELRGEVRIDGSSTVFPITEAAARGFREQAPGVDLSLGVSGTGGGFARFCAGEIDISGASRPIKSSEEEACTANGIDFIELPIAYDGISVVVSAGNDWVECVTVAELGRMWAPAAEGLITSWSAIRPTWPDRPLLLRGPGPDSGTYDYFTAATVGEEGVSRSDFIASEDDYLIAQDVVENPDALGFFGYAYLVEYGDLLRGVAIDNGAGCIAPSTQTIVDGSYQPLSRPIFLYVRPDALDRPEVAAFLAFYLRDATALVEQVRYVPLPPRAYTLAASRLERRLTGSVFAGGAQIGVSLEQLLELEGEE
jgi:phosphate transport system substrate-binding protein